MDGEVVRSHMQQSPSRRKARGGVGLLEDAFFPIAFKGLMTGGTGNLYGLRRLHNPSERERYNTMVFRSSGPRLRTWPSRAPASARRRSE